MKSTHGFTLIEILVVVVIIGTLAALLTGGFQKTVEHARNVKCQKKLRQLFLASCSFSADNDNDQLSQSADKVWTRQIMPYLGVASDELLLTDPFRCPSAPKRPQALYWQPDYAVNAHSAIYYPGIWPTGGIKAGLQEKPSATVAFLDWLPGWMWVRQSEFAIVNGQRHDEVFRHNGRLNAVFIDGHIETLTAPLPVVASKLPWH